MNNADLIKTQLATFNRNQQLAFPHSEVISLLTQRSDFYDQLLHQLWHQMGFSERSDLALIAVGGYGRKEMFPLSDLDILILTEYPLDEPTQTQLNHLFTLLWDAKLQVGATIRTLAQCMEIGNAELSVATNMLESRFILGNLTLWQQLISQLYQDNFWSIADFYHAKIAEKNQRYARYHNTSYNLEPDLKHSPGGLRDLHLLLWIMLRHYGIHSLDGLMNKGILYPEEYQELTQAQSVLFKMRFGLHLQLKRYDNRLRFDQQLQLSEQLGYQGEGNQPVETMMKAFFQATQTISQLSQLLLNHFEQEVLYPLQKKGEKRPLDPDYFCQDNLIFCQNPRCFNQKPETILALFWHLTQIPTAQVAPQTLRQLRLALRRLHQPLSALPSARQRFIQLLQQPQVVSRAIVPMHQLGVLSAYLPQWQQISGLMQFDLFHIYTVDEHTIRVMLKLESFLNAENLTYHPLCCQLLPTLPQHHLLYLSALFHDIGKGRSGDHAHEGALDMRQFAKLHQFNADETEYMVWLVAQHLTMSITAQRRDIHDPEVIQQFAQIVADPDRLSALTCLTVADICATNETLWNDWKRSLLNKLYHFTLEQLQLGNQTRDQRKLAQQQRQEALEQMKFVLSATQQQQLQQFWQNCPEHYFLLNHPTQLVWHALSYLKKPYTPMVLVSNQYSRGATEIFIFCHDQPKLFARLAQTLSLKKISIHDAQIITSENGFVLDSFIVTELNGQPLNQARSEQIHSAIIKTLHLTSEQSFTPNKKPIKHQSFKRKTFLRFLPHSAPNQTAFELFTADREGLLAQIGDIFNQQQLILHNAKITTIGERVEDFFVISTINQQALNPEQQILLQQQLLQDLAP